MVTRDDLVKIKWATDATGEQVVEDYEPVTDTDLAEMGLVMIEDVRAVTYLTYMGFLHCDSEDDDCNAEAEEFTGELLSALGPKEADDGL